MNTADEKAAKPREYTVFVSHASADSDRAKEFVDAIERKGLTAWIAPRNITPGREYAEEIINGIDSSKCFVLLVSEASNLSAHVRREVERAASKSKPIYPVRIEDVPPSPKLEYFISIHQSIDALDGVVATYAERIAAAIASEEEWVGNRVISRRRRWRVGAGLSAVLLSVVITVGVVFAPDIRALFSSEQERAAVELVERGYMMNGAGVAQAMSGGNVGDLDLFLTAGATPGMLTEGFAQVARTFFERSIGNPEAMRWLKEAIATGVDPNLTVPNEAYGQSGLISEAFASGNAEAVIALLEAGASPHAYQDLHLSPYVIPRILFPFSYAIDNERWTEVQQADVARALAAAGAGLVPPEKDAYSFSHRHRQAYDLLTNASERWDLSSAILPSGCAARVDKRLCEAATARTGTNWCDLAAALPEQVTWAKSYDHRMLAFTIHQFLTAARGRGYFLATSSKGYDGGYALLEVGANGRIWNLYRYISPGAGLGHCKSYQGEDGFRPEQCWRRFSWQWEPDRSIARLENYYDYPARECRKSDTPDG